jgi:hypothetical protein
MRWKVTGLDDARTDERFCSAPDAIMTGRRPLMASPSRRPRSSASTVKRGHHFGATTDLPHPTHHPLVVVVVVVVGYITGLVSITRAWRYQATSDTLTGCAATYRPANSCGFNQRDCLPSEHRRDFRCSAATLSCTIRG